MKECKMEGLVSKIRRAGIPPTIGKELRIKTGERRAESAKHTSPGRNPGISGPRCAQALKTKPRVPPWACMYRPFRAPPNPLQPAIFVSAMHLRNTNAKRPGMHSNAKRWNEAERDGEGSIPCFLTSQSRQGRQTIARQFIAGVETSRHPKSR